MFAVDPGVDDGSPSIFCSSKDKFSVRLMLCILERLTLSSLAPTILFLVSIELLIVIDLQAAQIIAEYYRLLLLRNQQESFAD